MLQVSDNKLKRISPMIGGLRKLKCLLLHNNLLKNIPTELHMLKSLQEFSLEWFAHLHPPVNKVLKDERGFLLIQDLLKLCTLVNELGEAKSSQQVTFIHFLCFFTKHWSLDNLATALSYPKERTLAHSLC